MVAFRAAVVALLACLAAGCGSCCGPCGYPPPPCCSNCYQPCYGCGVPCGPSCSTCGPQIGWQQGHGQQMFAMTSYPQFMMPANGPMAEAPTMASGCATQQPSRNQLASYSRQDPNQLVPITQAPGSNQQPGQAAGPSAASLDPIYTALRQLKACQNEQFNDIAALTGRYNCVARRMNLPPLYLQSCGPQLSGLPVVIGQ
jgi:hypothetical protein